MRYLGSLKVKKKLLRKATLFEKKFQVILDKACHRLVKDGLFDSYRIKPQFPHRLSNSKYAYPDFTVLLHSGFYSHVLFFEIDGGYHSTEEKIQDDAVRTFLLTRKFPGSEVYRFDNEELFDGLKLFDRIHAIIIVHRNKFAALNLDMLYRERKRGTAPECDLLIGG